MTDTPNQLVKIAYNRVKEQHRAEHLGAQFRFYGFDTLVSYTEVLNSAHPLVVIVEESDNLDIQMTFDQALMYLKRFSSAVQVEILPLENLGDLPLPSYETNGAAGMDLRAALVDGAYGYVLPAGSTGIVPCGFSIALPEGYEAQIRPRSGLAAKHGITVLNSPGTIDSDYRGEVMAILINHSKADYVINRGERIAQMVIAPVAHARLVPVKALSPTSRGEGKFGSTGK